MCCVVVVVFVAYILLDQVNMLLQFTQICYGFLYERNDSGNHWGAGQTTCRNVSAMAVECCLCR